MNDRIKLIIFDLDGLLVDSERVFYKAFKSVAKRYGKVPSFQNYTLSTMAAGKDISTIMNLEGIDAETFRNAVYRTYEKMLSQVSIRPGAIECLKRLKGYDCALVTGSKRAFADVFIKRFSFEPFFSMIITRDDGFDPKPSPSMFEHILEVKQCKPWECIVIEDSRRGITAALSLGIPCVYIPTDYTRHDTLSPRVKVFRALNEISIEMLNSTMCAWYPRADHTLAQLYGDSIARLNDTFKVYRDIYGLENFIHRDENVLPEAFEYAKKRSFFIILIMTTCDGRVYFTRSFDTGHLTIVPPGAGLHLDKNDTILGAIHRIARRVLPNAQIADIAPLVYLNNIFVCTDGRIVEHIGLGVRAVLLNESEEISHYDNNISVKGGFYKQVYAQAIPQPPARKTYERFCEWNSCRDYSTYLNEIKGQRKVLKRYLFHQKFVNPIFVKLSKCFGAYSIVEMKRSILSRIGYVSSCIDVACGDDKGIFDISNQVPLVVANDIAIDHILMLEKVYLRKKHRIPKAHALLFTNHDCLDLPFRENAFDVSICRNLLHHMQAAKDLTGLLSNLRRVARKMVIVEMEDPSDGSLLERMRHRYYINWLKDEGKHFYKRQDFEKILSRHFVDDNVCFEYIPTIRGTYMIAEVKKS